MNDPDLKNVFSVVGNQAWDKSAVLAKMGAEVFKSPEFAKKYADAQQEVQRLANYKILDMNGTAVSDHEFQRTMKEIRGGGDADGVVNGLNAYLGLMRDWDDAARVSMDESTYREWLRRYNYYRNMDESLLGGTPSASGAKPPTGGPTAPFSQPRPPPKPSKDIPDDLFAPPRK
jgi:hypothetical protein